MERYLKKGGSRPTSTTAAATKKEIDERRLRKLKVYLKSVSYNSCEGLPKFPTLPDLYESTILCEEFPCDTMQLKTWQHCAPTPFLIACCFNRRYPVNVRKRTRNIRSTPVTQQHSEKINNPAGQKNILTTGNTIYSGKEASKIIKDASNSDLVKKLSNSSIVRAKAGKKDASTMVVQDKFTKNRKTNDLELSKESYKSLDDKITTKYQDQQTGNFNTEILPPEFKEKYLGEKEGNNPNSVLKTESCGLSRCDGKKESVRCGDESSAVDESTSKKVTVKKTEIIERSKENKEYVLCEEKADCLATNRHSQRKEVGKALEVTSGLENCATKEAPTATEKESNQGSSSGACSESLDFLCQIGPKNQKVTGKSDETTDSRPKEDETRVNPNTNEKICTEKQRRDEEASNISNISAGPSHHTSTRLVTLCQKHNKTVSAIQDKKRIVQRKDANRPESTNIRLRSRAVIKQPSHEKRYSKSNPRSK